jgi:hypothetical protein
MSQDVLFRKELLWILRVIVNIICLRTPSLTGREMVRLRDRLDNLEKLADIK